MTRHSVASALEQHTFLTFGGNETYLLFLQGYPLREFCAFEVTQDEPAWLAMERELLGPIADAAAESGLGLIADCFVWRASPDYVSRLGFGAQGVGEVNARAVARTRRFIEDWRAAKESRRSCPVLVSGDVGPRGDGYALGDGGAIGVEAAYDYHAPQIEALAKAGVDLVVALTMTSKSETVGLLRAAARAGLPVVVSPTLETDGRLPDGSGLGELVDGVDGATGGQPVGYMVNCVHPTHVTPALRVAADGDAPWLARLKGLRANASTKSHAELDDSTELDRGDPSRLAREIEALRRDYSLSIVGGCCGTDAAHLRAIAEACRAQDHLPPRAGTEHACEPMPSAP